MKKNQLKWIIIFGAGSELANEALKKLNEKNKDYAFILIGKKIKKLNKYNEYVANKKLIKIVSDVVDEKLHEKILNTCKSKKIKVYGAINFVGIHSFLPINFINYNSFEKVFKTNVYSFVNLVSFFSKNKKILYKKTSVINISSVSSLKGNKSISLYSSSKAACNNLVKSFSLELSSKSIRINSILLGHFEKGISRKTNKFLNSNQMNDLKLNHPLGFGKYSSLAGGIEYLLNEDNDWVTGTNLIIDGGYSAI